MRTQRTRRRRKGRRHPAGAAPQHHRLPEPCHRAAAL